jgi:UDPglucose 6-dehydrogenase
VTAACCARHFEVVGLDFDASTVAGLAEGRAPIREPGLNERLAEGLAGGSLRFTTDPGSACAGAGILWLCHDTPVNEHDESDAGFVLEQLRRALPHLAPGALVLISSQLPVGTCAALEREFPAYAFACSPENLRLGRALDAFEKADRVVVGLRDDAKRAVLEALFRPFTANVLFMRTESAEMVKHALNAFLAVSITFINEIARLCEHAGADAREVAAGLKSEPRIGPKAYLGPGGPFAGGTLARDVVTLTRLGRESHESLSLIPAIKESNDRHRGWTFRRLQSLLPALSGRTIAVLGLVYTPQTDTLRRSAAVELCRQLAGAGVHVRAFDPAIPGGPDAKVPTELALPAGCPGSLALAPDLGGALRGADAAVICTEWPEFRQADWDHLLPTMTQALLLDANRFLDAALAPFAGKMGVRHMSVGR